jgi:hypothetical protein
MLIVKKSFKSKLPLTLNRQAFQSLYDAMARVGQPKVGRKIMSIARWQRDAETYLEISVFITGLLAPQGDCCALDEDRK